MFLSCPRCSAIYEPIGSPHPAPSLCPQCSAQKCSRCGVPGPTNPRGLCIWCAISTVPTSRRCERCGWLEEQPGAVVAGRCVDAAGCDEHLAVWGEPSSLGDGEQYAGAVEP